MMNLIFIIIMNSFSWYAVKDNDCKVLPGITPQVAYDFATSKDGGFTNCRIINHTPNAVMVICVEPTDFFWFFVRSLADCNMYKSDEFVVALLKANMECTQIGSIPKCTFIKKKKI